MLYQILGKRPIRLPLPNVLDDLSGCPRDFIRVLRPVSMSDPICLDKRSMRGSVAPPSRRRFTMALPIPVVLHVTKALFPLNSFRNSDLFSKFLIIIFIHQEVIKISNSGLTKFIRSLLRSMQCYFQ